MTNLQKTQHNAAWIKVSECKPPDGVPVLTYPGWGMGNKAAIDEWAAQYNCFLMSIEEGERVTHWMPLPEPPTEEVAFCPCVCHSDEQRRLCRTKNECVRVEAHSNEHK